MSDLPDSTGGDGIASTLCADLNRLQQAIYAGCGGTKGFPRQAETLVIDEYNDIVGRAREHELRSTREIDLGATYGDVLSAIDIQRGRLGCPERRIQLMSDEFAAGLD